MTEEYKPVMPQIPTELLVGVVCIAIVLVAIFDRPQPIHSRAEMMRAYKCVADYRDTDKVKYKDCLDQIDRDKYGHTNEL